MRYLGALVILISIFYSSCTESNYGTDSKTVFRYNESKGIATLDPVYARNQTIIWPVNQIFNGLLQMDKDLNIQPSIAKSWDISENGLVYTFYLRNDVQFHNHPIFNGDRIVVAEDFVYSLNRIIDPKNASPGFWIMDNVERKNGRLNCQAIDDTTLQIVLNNPFPGFLGVLTMQYCSVVPKEIVALYKDDFRSNPIGTGPFRFKLWVEGEKLVLLKNENYFEKDSLGANLPYLDAVAITFINDKQSEFLEFITGKIDFISGVNQVYKDEILTHSGQLKKSYQDKIKLLKGPYLNTEYLGFLLDPKFQKNTALLNPDVRRAINFGIDREKMMLFLRNNIGIPATNGFVPPGMPSSKYVIKGFDYNPEKSKSLLEKAGFPNGEGIEDIILTTTSDYVDLCEFIQFQLSEIGIPIQIEIASGGSFRDMVANSRLDFFRGSWIADYPEAENYLSLFKSANFSPNGPNYTHFSSLAFDNLYEQVLIENNLSKRKDLYLEMDQLVIENAIIVPLFYDEVVRLTKPNILGLETNPMNLLTLKTVLKK